MSELIQTPLAALRPIQATLGFDPVSNSERITNEPITTLLYEGELNTPEAAYLILDGHHRVRLAHYLGQQTINSIVFTADKDIRTSRLSSLVWCGGTVEGVKETYQKEWLPRLQERGVHDITSLIL